MQRKPVSNFPGALQRRQQASQGSVSQCFLHKLRSSVQSRSLPAGSPAGNSPVPCPGAATSNSPTSKLRAVAAEMHGATADGSSSMEAVIGNGCDPSLGQKMAQSQASWQPLPVGTWPIVASSAPSAAAYSMPMQDSRHQGCQTPSAARPHAGRHQQHTELHSQSEVSTGMPMESSQHESTATPALSHTAQLLHHFNTDSAENMQQAGMHAAEAGPASGHQPQASLESGILVNQQQPQQQQPQQQQQSARADSSVLEWCSRADELLQLSAAPGEAALMQAALPGSLQTGLTILPAYSGAAVLLGPLILHSQAMVLIMIMITSVRNDGRGIASTVLVTGLSSFFHCQGLKGALHKHSAHLRHASAATQSQTSIKNRV